MKSYRLCYIYFLFNTNTPETTNPLSYLHLLFFPHYTVFVFAFICLFSFVKINTCLLNSVSHYDVNITVYFVLLSLLCTMHHLSLTAFGISPVLSVAVNNTPQKPNRKSNPEIWQFDKMYLKDVGMRVHFEMFYVSVPLSLNS